MVTVHQATLVLLIIQIYVGAAPNSMPKLEDAAKTENGTLPLDNQPSPIDESKGDGKAADSQRQKRFYSHYGYGFPPLSPVQYPTHNKRDQGSELGLYGIDDPLSQIHKRLHEIASIVRQPVPPPPPIPTHFPFYFPVIFVPQYCACSPNSDTKNTTAKPATPPPNPPIPTKPPVDGGTTLPDIFNRWPVMEDERQNWGFVVNESDEYALDEDFTRPISFDPIVPLNGMSRPAPPVEHGSNQAGAGQMSTTTPPPSSNDVSGPPPAAAAGSLASSGPYPTNSVETSRAPPTTCDAAILSCCHQPQISYECFSVLGCPDPTSYGNPCDPLVILKVIGKYQQFYGVRKES